MGNSMLEAAALTGLDLRLVAPKSCWPEEDLVNTCQALAQKRVRKSRSRKMSPKALKMLIYLYRCGYRWRSQRSMGTAH